MRTLFIILSMFCFSMTSQAQSPEGSWTITTLLPDGSAVSWELTFKSNGTYTVDLNLNGITDITGKYSVEGSTITVQNDPECGCCKDKGIYKFGIENNKLWMDPVDDPCDDRRPPEKAFFSKA